MCLSTVHLSNCTPENCVNLHPLYPSPPCIPCISVSLHPCIPCIPCIPASLASLHHCILASLHPCIPASLHPLRPLRPCLPCILASLHHCIPASLNPTHSVPQSATATLLLPALHLGDPQLPSVMSRRLVLHPCVPMHCISVPALSRRSVNCESGYLTSRPASSVPPRLSRRAGPFRSI